MHYAIIDDRGLYLAQQGSEEWFQDTCIGWVLCSADLQWITDIAVNHSQDLFVVNMRQGSDHRFYRD